MERRDLLAALTGLGVTGLAGCASSGSGDDSEPTDAATTTTAGMGGMETTTGDRATTQSTATDTATASPTAGDDVDASVSIPGFEFSPLRLSVAPGATVEWTNNDTVGHNVVSGNFHDKAVAWQFQSRTVDEGGTVTYTFPETGVYEYYCSIHGKSTMSGAVLVGDVTLEQDLPSEGGGY